MDINDVLDCILINLERSPERLERMQNRLTDHNLLFRRIPAVDGKKTVFTEHQIDAGQYERCHGKYITPTEVACYVSHYNAITAFLESDKEIALILEDDMVFAKDFNLLLKQLIQNHNAWDMVKLNGTRSWAFPVTVKKLTDKYRLVLNLLHQAKAGAYLINRHAAKNFAKGLLPMAVPLDHEFIKYWKYDIRLASVLPFPTWEEGEGTTIDYDMVKKNRKPWYRRIRTGLYRSGIAIKRLCFASGAIYKMKHFTGR